jgi:hypothetical protein
VSIGSAIKAASARFADAFWRGFEEAWAESGAQSVRSAAQTAASVEVGLLVQRAFDDGVQAERKRIAEVLQAPGVASYPLLAFELAVDGASVAQVSAVIARTEVAVQARIHPTESSPLESSTPTLH